MNHWSGMPPFGYPYYPPTTPPPVSIKDAIKDAEETITFLEKWKEGLKKEKDKDKKVLPQVFSQAAKDLALLLFATIPIQILCSIYLLRDVIGPIVKAVHPN